MIRTRYTIEENAYGATYRETGFTVYKLGVYPPSSVLAGQRQRVWMDNFPTLAEAREAYPDAEYIEGSTYQDINSVVAHLPDEDEDTTRAVVNEECPMCSRVGQGPLCKAHWDEGY